jgi:hypothetical protein
MAGTGKGLTVICFVRAVLHVPPLGVKVKITGVVEFNAALYFVANGVVPSLLENVPPAQRT